MNYLSFVVLLVLSVALGAAYTLLGLKARTHLISEASATTRSVGWLFWWSFDKEKYKPEGKKICKAGDLLFVPLIACWIAWYVFLLK